MIFILQTKKLRYRKVQWLAKCQMVGAEKIRTLLGLCCPPSHRLAAAGALRDAVCSTHDRVVTGSVNIL